MNHRKAVPTVSILILATILAGCNLPTNPTPTEFVFPTPNQTMTAIFQPPVIVEPTNTPAGSEATQPTVQAATSAPTREQPSATALPPTSTSAPKPEITLTLQPRLTWSAAYLSSAPTINGNWDEWTSPQYPMRFVVYGAKNWTGSSDLEGAYRIGWDTTNLYVAVKVTDNQFVQNATKGNIYQGDSIEILFDANLNGDATSEELTGDDYQIGISAGRGEIGKNMEAYLWFPSAKAGSLSGVKMAAVPMSGGYRIEMAIPWTVFGVTPADGQKYGFNVSISDNDNPKENLQQKMVSANPYRVLVDPTTWGTLTLKK